MIKGLVSIIVPVYNVDKFLRKCLESILNQTYTAIEIILVDDGSIDYSGCICDEYATRYKQIRVLHQKNGGVSKARNIGLEMMRGEYFTFVDGDDTIEPVFIEIMLEEMNKNNVDLVRLSWTRGNSIKTYFAPFNNSDKYLVSLNNLNDLLWFANIWGLFRSDCLQTIRFDEQLKYAEDNLFIFEYFIKSPSKRMLLINKPFYHYTITENSATVIETSERLKRSLLFLSKLDQIENVQIDIEKLKNKYVYKDFLALYYYFVDNNITSKDGYTRKELEKKICFLRKSGCKEITLSGRVISFLYRHHLHFILVLYRTIKNLLKM